MLTFASFLVYNSIVKNESELEEEYEQVPLLRRKRRGKERDALLQGRVRQLRGLYEILFKQGGRNQYVGDARRWWRRSGRQLGKA